MGLGFFCFFGGGVGVCFVGFFFNKGGVLRFIF